MEYVIPQTLTITPSHSPLTISNHPQIFDASSFETYSTPSIDNKRAPAREGKEVQRQWEWEDGWPTNKLIPAPLLVVLPAFATQIKESSKSLLHRRFQHQLSLHNFRIRSVLSLVVGVFVGESERGKVKEGIKCRNVVSRE